MYDACVPIVLYVLVCLWLLCVVCCVFGVLLLFVVWRLCDCGLLFVCCVLLGVCVFLVFVCIACCVLMAVGCLLFVV